MRSENDENTQWPNAPAKEDIEGLDSGGGSREDACPIDSLLIRRESHTIHEVLQQPHQNRFVVNPDFHLDFVWPGAKQSKLIESVIMRIPLPAFYLAEDRGGKIMVVDGVQRLATFHRFLNNKLKLQLPDRKELDGKAFKDLDKKFQNRIKECNLIIYAIDSKVPERDCLDIFERVNSGGPLSRQQMRNCMHIGKAAKFLKTEARTDLFLRATGERLNQETMRDCEFVNRFCAFKLLGVDAYKGDMDDFLSECLREMNAKEDEELLRLSAKFRRGLANSWVLFGKHAFRKREPKQESPNPLNASLWDVMSTGLSEHKKEPIREHAKSLNNAFFSLLKDLEFNDAITDDTNNSTKVKNRFTLADTLFFEEIPQC